MAVDSLSDDELLQLKKRARRRLVGAIALMLIALIVLRFVVESRPLPNEKPAKIAIDGIKPTPDTQATSAFSSPKNAESHPVAPDVLPPPPTEPETDGPEQPSAVADVPLKETKPTAPAVSERKPAQETKPKPIAQPEKKPRAASSPQASAKAPKTGGDVGSAAKPAPSPSKPGRHVASVVALSDAGKAAELRRKLQASGLKVFTETVELEGKTLTRVKIGPYETADDLEKARAKLAMMGL